MSDNYSVDYLRDNAKIVYGLLQPQKVDSVCEFFIELSTPDDPDGKSAALIEIHFMDYHRIGEPGATFPVEMEMGIHELKVLRAFPRLLEILTDFEGIQISIEDLCSKLDKAGYERILDDGVQYLPIDPVMYEVAHGVLPTSEICFTKREV